MNDFHEIAVAWVLALNARGVSLSVKGNRFTFKPGTAYAALSKEEALTFRTHREAIKEVLRDPAETGRAARPVAPAPCPYCYQAPCIGREHPAHAVLHELEEQEVWHRRMEQNEKDAREWELRRMYGLPSPTWE